MIVRLADSLSVLIREQNVLHRQRCDAPNMARIGGLAPLIVSSESVYMLQVVASEQGLKPYIKNCDKAAASCSARVQALLARLQAEGALPPTWYEVDWAAPPPPVLPVTFALGAVYVRLF